MKIQWLEKEDKREKNKNLLHLDRTISYYDSDLFLLRLCFNTVGNHGSPNYSQSVLVSKRVVKIVHVSGKPSTIEKRKPLNCTFVSQDHARVTGWIRDTDWKFQSEISIYPLNIQKTLFLECCSRYQWKLKYINKYANRVPVSNCSWNVMWSTNRCFINIAYNLEYF